MVGWKSAQAFDYGPFGGCQDTFTGRPVIFEGEILDSTNQKTNILAPFRFLTGSLSFINLELRT